MLVLAVDTSGAEALTALVSSEGLELQEHLSRRKSSEEGLGTLLRALLARAGLKVGDLDLLAVGLGPGSFTGVRIGVSFMKTLAWCLPRPIFGLSGLLALAAGQELEGPVAVLLRAHQRAVYGALFECTGPLPAVLRPIGLWEPRALLSDLPPGTLVVSDQPQELAPLLAELGLTRVLKQSAIPPLTLARLAAKKLEAGQSPDSPMSLQPLYCQASGAERS